MFGGQETKIIEFFLPEPIEFIILPHRVCDSKRAIKYGAFT